MAFEFSFWERPEFYIILLAITIIIFSILIWIGNAEFRGWYIFLRLVALALIIMSVITLTVEKYKYSFYTHDQLMDRGIFISPNGRLSNEEVKRMIANKKSRDLHKIQDYYGGNPYLNRTTDKYTTDNGNTMYQDNIIKRKNIMNRNIIDV